jgi:isoleucyl-tRNA synthetase
MDRYILTVLNSTIREVDDDLANYRVPEAAKALYKLVDELSNWYVRRSRERYWGTEMTEDKIAAYMTLYTALVTISKISAPMIPFMADDIYRNLVGSVDRTAPVSVHLCSFPEADVSMIDEKLEADMEAVVDIVVLGRAARNGANIKNRQPLKAIYVGSKSRLQEYYADIIRDELNVKDVIFEDDLSDLTSYSFKPNLKTVGPKYGKLLGEIRNILQDPAFDGSAAMAELKSTGSIRLNAGGQEAVLGEEDLLIEIKQKEGFWSVSDHGLTVALDINLTEDLINEGFIRELTSKVQTMRKEADFVVTDHIRVFVDGSTKLEVILAADSRDFMNSVLCDELNFGKSDDGYSKEWDINGENVTICVKKL